MRRYRILIGWQAPLLVLLSATPSPAQEPRSAPVRAQAEEDGIEELRREQESLRRRLEELERQASPEGLDSSQQSESDLGGEDGYETLPPELLGLGLVARYGVVEAAFQFFGDAGFRYRNPELMADSHSSFLGGSLDIFSTVRVGDNFRVLLESVVHLGRDDFVFSQQRLYAAWTFHDALYAKVGLEHTPTSYWNRTFHHGRWLETSIDRPLLASFEGEEGILAGHSVGIELGGQLPVPGGRLGYVAVASNGRGVSPRDRGTITDRNDDKALDLALSFSPAGVLGLQCGIAGRVDNIPPDASRADRNQSFRELAGSAFIAYHAHGFECLAEILYIHHTDRREQDNLDHYAAYIQLGHRFGTWMPYTRFDIRDMDEGDAFYRTAGRDLDKLQQVFGVRWDFIENAALKFELGLGRQEDRGSGGTERDGVVTAAAQLSWVF